MALNIYPYLPREKAQAITAAAWRKKVLAVAGDTPENRKAFNAAKKRLMDTSQSTFWKGDGASARFWRA